MTGSLYRRIFCFNIVILQDLVIKFVFLIGHSASVYSSPILFLPFSRRNLTPQQIEDLITLKYTVYDSFDLAAKEVRRTGGIMRVL